MSGAGEKRLVAIGDGIVYEAIVTKLDNDEWRAQTPVYLSWSVRPTPRAAVADLFGVSPGEVFGPGETPEERAAFARGVEAMRAAAVALCREAAKGRTRSELALEQRIQFITIEPEQPK